MRSYSGPERFVLSVFYPVVVTGFYHDLGEPLVMHMADCWEQVMFEVKVEPADEPAQERAVPSIIRGCVGLMNRPGIFDLTVVLTG